VLVNFTSVYLAGFLNVQRQNHEMSFSTWVPHTVMDANTTIPTTC